MRVKYIDHERYSAPGGRKRDFRQRVENRRATPSVASRLALMAFRDMAGNGTILELDATVRSFIDAGVRFASNMARRKFYVARPKPEDNRHKNQARRARRKAYLVANETKHCQGNKPAPAIIINAGQRRIQAGRDNVRAHRGITSDCMTGKRNWGWSDSKMSGRGARECARRRRQMGTEEFARS